MTRTEGTTYEGSVYTLGLFPSTDATYTTGPGILQLAILARFGESEKVFRAGINLQQSIRDAQLIEKASEKDCPVRYIPYSVIHINGYGGGPEWLGSWRISISQ